MYFYGVSFGSGHTKDVEIMEHGSNQARESKDTLTQAAHQSAGSDGVSVLSPAFCVCLQGSTHYSMLPGSLRDGPVLTHFFTPPPFLPLCPLSLLFS